MLTRVLTALLIFHKKRGKPRKSSLGGTKSSTNFEAAASHQHRLGEGYRVLKKF